MGKLFVQVERIEDLTRRMDDYFTQPKQDRKPLTNYDLVRAMSVEELAEFIGHDPMHDSCPNNCYEDLDRQCEMCALDWLKQEATDGDV